MKAANWGLAKLEGHFHDGLRFDRLSVPHRGMILPARYRSHCRFLQSRVARNRFQVARRAIFINRGAHLHDSLDPLFARLRRIYRQDPLDRHSRHNG